MNHFCDQPNRMSASGKRRFAKAGRMRAFGYLLGLLATPALASVAAGVTKWQAGDWRGAVAEWSAPAQRGDVDAMFNMGQAYLLGRGVQQDRNAATDLFRRAAAKGHVGATASLGILLWQDGRRTEALQHLRTAADKGELRAAYVLGVATFSGDAVPRNQALGYAYIVRARDGGLPVAQQQAGRFATQMTADERMRGEAAAQAMASGRPVGGLLAGTAPASTLQTDSGTDARQAALSSDNEDSAEEAAVPVRTASRTEPRPTGRSGTTADDKPAERPAAKGKGKAGVTETVSRSDSKGAASKAEKAGGFRVQLGAYNSEQAAKSAWTTLVSQQAGLLKKLKPHYLARGGLVRLQVGSFDDRNDARDLCQKLSAAGRPCFVTSG